MLLSRALMYAHVPKLKPTTKNLEVDLKTISDLAELLMSLVMTMLIREGSHYDRERHNKRGRLIGSTNRKDARVED